MLVLCVIKYHIVEDLFQGLLLCLVWYINLILIILISEPLVLTYVVDVVFVSNHKINKQ